MCHRPDVHESGMEKKANKKITSGNNVMNRLSFIRCRASNEETERNSLITLIVSVAGQAIRRWTE